MGINVNDATQAFTAEILSGRKTVETRATDSLRPYVGRRVGIVRTGVGRAVLVGFATIGEPIRYETPESFRADYGRHRDSKFLSAFCRQRGSDTRSLVRESDFRIYDSGDSLPESDFVNQISGIRFHDFDFVNRFSGVGFREAGLALAGHSLTITLSQHRKRRQNERILREDQVYEVLPQERARRSALLRV